MNVGGGEELRRMAAYLHAETRPAYRTITPHETRLLGYRLIRKATRSRAILEM